MNYLFQSICYYFSRLFRQAYLYLMVAMLGGFGAMPLHAKSKSKGSKAFIPFWLLGVLSCKDFKSWDSTYGYEVNIKFELKKDEQVPEKAEDLQSHKLETLFFKKPQIATSNGENVFLKNDLTIPLNPNANAVSFELEDENNIYHHKVTICYERKPSLISPEAGGLQIQYTIKRIQLSTKANKRSIVKGHIITKPIPLKEDKKDTTHHVTLYY